MIAAFLLAAALFDAGGVSFDFPVLSRVRYEETGFDERANLLTGDRSGAVKASGWKRSFALPDAKGGRFRFSAHYKAISPTVPGGGWCQVRTGDRQVQRYLAQCAHEWTMLTMPVEIEPGVRELTVRFQLENMEVEFCDLTLLREPPADPIEIKAAAMELLDGRYELAAESGGLVVLYWRKTDPKVTYRQDGFTFEVTLPRGIEFVDCTFAANDRWTTERRADGSTVTRITPRDGSATMLTTSFNFWEEIASVILVKASDGFRGRAGRATFGCRYEADGVRFAAKPVTLDFTVVDPVRVTPPKRYRNGILYGSTGGYDLPGCFKGGVRKGFDFTTRKGFELMSRTCADAGVKWMVARGTEDDYAYWRKLGIDRITVPGRRLANAFNLCRPGAVPPSDAYLLAQKKKDGTIELVHKREAVCPLSVYEKSSYFARETLPFVKEYVKGANGVWSNWEPWRFEGKGCMCERCLKAFAAYTGRSEAEVRSKWPKAVMKDGGEWYDEAKRFRSQVHAKLVRYLDGIVRPETGGEKSLGLIPAIAWIEMASYGKLNDYAAEVAAVDYAGDLRWMCPWGPYVAWGTNYPYHYRKRAPLCNWFAAKDVVARTNADYPAARRPKLLGCPQGYQCGHWVAQPEHIGMSLDAFFFNGFDSCVLFYFPRGYDARFWRAYANATARAAKYEAFVLDGERIDSRVRATPAKVYAAPVRAASEYLPGVRNVSLLQTAAFRLKARIIVAALNFWDKGEAFFKLKVDGLEGDDWRIVSEDGIRRVKTSEKMTWTAAELAKGVALEVGAARTRVFELSRESANGATGDSALPTVTDAAYRARFKERRASLEKSAADDAEFERLNGEPAMNAGPVL